MGPIVDGVPLGHGIITWSGGGRYECDVVRGKAEGIGKEYWPNGCLGYEGPFKGGWMDGEGISYRNDGGVKHKGVFLRSRAMKSSECSCPACV